MNRLSNDAFAIMATCDKAKKPFGITVDKIGAKQYRFMWAFKIDNDKARREGYDKTSVRGSIEFDAEYPGCPYCGRMGFYICGNCNKVICYNGEGGKVTCPNCGRSAGLRAAEEFDLKGGGY